MSAVNLRDRVRLNLEVQQDVKDRLDELQERTHASSLTEVIRRALALYNLVVDDQGDGGKVVLQNRDGSSETLTIL